MAEELPNHGESGTVAVEAAGSSAAVPASQPQPSCDSRLAAILAKQAAGEALTRKEAGYLGSVKRKGLRKAAPAKASENILLEVEDNPDNPLFEPVPLAQAPAVSSIAAAVDSALLRSTANALLSSMDTVTKIFIGHEAKAAGADPVTVEQYKSAVALQEGNRQLMVENSEPVILSLCEIFKCSPEKLETVLKSSGFVGGLVCHSLGVFTAVKSIRESRREREAQQPPKA